MFLFLSTLWFVWELKYVLFWLYLWQLKEYHIGRFLDHFRTYKGKKLIFSFAQIFKLVLLLSLLIDSRLFSYSFFILFLVYSAEFLVFLKQFILRTFKKPVITFKALFLVLVSFAVVILFLNWALDLDDASQARWLMTFDILTPLIISAVVLFFQPFFVAIRNNTLRKAKIKIEKMKPVSGLKVIAITGSYGKTSTKEFLTTVLSKKHKVLSTKEHQNSEIGIASCILNELKPSHQIFIAEVGAYNKGKVKEVCNILKPKIGIVTGVNEQHLSLFGSIKNLLSAEGGGELADALKKDGILVVNGDNKYCLDLLKRNKLPSSQERIYSLSSKTVDADIWADSITAHKDYVSFLVRNKKGELVHFDVEVLGKQNVQNLLAAILTAKELGMGLEQIVSACRDITPEQAGMVLEQGKHEINIIDSSYSANPDGVVADLDYLNIFPNKKVIVMPCLIELGSKSAEIHKKIGKKIGQVCDLAIITSRDKFEELKKGALEAGIKPKNILLCDNPQDIYSMITLFCKSGDAVLLEGRVPKELIKLLI